MRALLGVLALAPAADWLRFFVPFGEGERKRERGEAVLAVGLASLARIFTQQMALAFDLDKERLLRIADARALDLVYADAILLFSVLGFTKS